jgi:sugar/nucleoside kinase (ribokinase family)
MLDLISIGDPTIDTFLGIHEAHVAMKHHPDRQELYISYANKIPVDSFFRFPAGNMPNNVIGASRLGLKAACYGMVGQDGEGDWIIDKIKEEGVDTSYMRRDPKHGTNSSTVIVFQKERTIFVWHETRQYELPALPASNWVYFTSTGPLTDHLEKLHREVMGYLKTHSAKLAFNPGTYQLMLGREGLKSFLERSEIIFLNKEETQTLTGKNTDDVKVLLRSLKELGPNIAVITDGPGGSYAYDGKDYLAVGIYDTPVVERTGAGDSYGTGFMSARHYDLPVAEAMRWGTFNAAYVVGEYGGILGLQTKDQIEKLSREHPELKVKEI